LSHQSKNKKGENPEVFPRSCESDFQAARQLTSVFELGRASYRDFLALWKDADPDIPILKEAKAECAKLK
jgi:hypothetical protein